MCELPLLKASRKKKGEYDFDQVFTNVKALIKESDYVVGNLETICTGKEYGLTNHIFSFNTPESFVKSIKKSGIDMVTTATNHSLDRGIEGLIKNLEVLNKYKIKNIGTYRSEKDRNKIFVENFNGLRVAFLNYTYGTNAHINGVKLEDNERFHVNLMKPQSKELDKYYQKQRPKQIKQILARFVFKFISLKTWISIKKRLGLQYYTAFQDNEIDDIDPTYLEQIKLDIQDAKEMADLVIMCMHSGGQFHPEPGQYSKYMMNFMNENGVDIVVGNHPHVVQRFEVFNKGMFGAYSLGNFSISPSSVYVLPDHLPEYSIMLHIYINTKEKKIEKITFSILKIVEFKDGGLTVYPINKLSEEMNNKQRKKLKRDIMIIYNRFTGLDKQTIAIKKEYTLKNVIK